jgi:hypothetical protein
MKTIRNALVGATEKARSAMVPIPRHSNRSQIMHAQGLSQT